MDRQTDRWTDRLTDRDRDRQTAGQTDRQTDKQTNRQTFTGYNNIRKIVCKSTTRTLLVCLPTVLIISLR